MNMLLLVSFASMMDSLSSLRNDFYQRTNSLISSIHYFIDLININLTKSFVNPYLILFMFIIIKSFLKSTANLVKLKS